MRFSFTTLALVMMAILTNPGTDDPRYAADLSAPAAAALASSVASGPVSSNS